MSDDFQGDDNTTDDRNNISADLDLFNVSSSCKKYWMLPECSPLHRAVTILIRKGIPYSTGEKILARILEATGKKDITPANFSMTDKKLKQWGLSSQKIAAIRQILSLPEVTPRDLCKIKEGGIHLVKSFKVMTELDDDVFLNTDYNVLRNLGILFGRSKPMTSTEATIVSRNWIGYRSQISYFLHRLKPEGAVKVFAEQKLEPWDFWGVDPPSLESLLEFSSSESDGEYEVPDLVDANSEEDANLPGSDFINSLDGV